MSGIGAVRATPCERTLTSDKPMVASTPFAAFDLGHDFALMSALLHFGCMCSASTVRQQRISRPWSRMHVRLWV